MAECQPLLPCIRAKTGVKQKYVLVAMCQVICRKKAYFRQNDAALRAECGNVFERIAGYEPDLRQFTGEIDYDFPFFALQYQNLHDVFVSADF